MRSYREYCPIARTSEILAERWTPLVVRNLVHGCTTFSEIARGVPTMSRSLLAMRLEALERAGVIVREPKPSGRGFVYELTDAGRALEPVLDAMAQWGEQWLDVTTDHDDPGFVLWTWQRFWVDHDRLPGRAVVVELRFPDEPARGRRWWLVVDHGELELCASDPGAVPDVCVVARSWAFTQWHLGRRSWEAAVAAGEIEVSGDPAVAGSLPSWNRHPWTAAR